MAQLVCNPWPNTCLCLRISAVFLNVFNIETLGGGGGMEKYSKSEHLKEFKY